MEAGPQKTFRNIDKCSVEKCKCQVSVLNSTSTPGISQERMGHARPSLFWVVALGITNAEQKQAHLEQPGDDVAGGLFSFRRRSEGHFLSS
jgi:hypothetical protein